MITKEKIVEIAAIRFGDKEYGKKELQKVGRALDIRKAYYQKNLSMQDDEAEEKAIEDLKVPVMAKKGGERGKIKSFVKEALLYFWHEGKKTASAYEVTMWAVREGKYHTESPKGVGDTMGKGKGSLFLEVAVDKVDGKKALVIPDPDKFPTWYKENIPLPEEYYSESTWEELNRGEGPDGGSHFLERFL